MEFETEIVCNEFNRATFLQQIYLVHVNTHGSVWSTTEAFCSENIWTIGNTVTTPGTIETLKYMDNQYLVTSCSGVRASCRTVVAGEVRMEETWTLPWQGLIWRHHPGCEAARCPARGAEGFPRVGIFFGHCGCGHPLLRRNTGLILQIAFVLPHAKM